MNPTTSAAALRSVEALAHKGEGEGIGIVALDGVGGSSRVAMQVARGLAAEQLPVVFLSGAETHRSPPETLKLPVQAVPVPDSPRAASDAWVSALAASLVDAVRANDLGLLNVHYAVGMAAAAVEARRLLAAQGRQLRVCVTLHGTDVTGFGRDSRQGSELARVLSQCDEVTAVSDWLADRAVEFLGLDRRPTVIVNGVDTELFRPHGRAYRLERPILCHASNFREVKRPLDAIALLERLRAAGLDAQLWMVGDGPLRRQAELRASPLASAVRFLPTMSHVDLAAFLGEVDLSVVTSASESFGLFALESMASGVPVLATRCGGLEEVFDADPSGELYAALTAEVGDVAGLAKRAAALFRDAQSYERLQRRTLAVGRSAFPQARQMHAYFELLTRLRKDERT